MKDITPVRFEMMCAFNGASSYEDEAMQFALELAEVQAGLELKVSELADATASCGRLLSSKEKAEIERQNDRYAEVYKALVDLRFIEDTVLVAAADYGEQTITEQEALTRFPVMFIETSTTSEHVSKRRQAIAAEEQSRQKVRQSDDRFIHPYYKGTAGGGLLYGDISISQGPEVKTDPRRIASGRDRTRYNAGKGVSSFEAEEAFMHVTADTHGGKSRNHGKNGKRYVGKNGRSVRKK